MNQLDIILRTIILIIFLAEIFYIIPKVMIPDIIREFKNVFIEENNNITETQQKNIDIRI
jgi:hypothetical protein